MKTNSTNKSKQQTSSAKTSTGKISTQSQLSFGNAGKLGLKKVVQTQEINDEKPNTIENSESKKRSQMEPIVQHDDEVVILEEAPKTGTKRLKRNDGTSDKVVIQETVLKEITVQKNEISNVVQEEVKEVVASNLPPKNIDKLRPCSSLVYDPIIDAPFHKGQLIPFSFLAKGLSEIETCKGQNSKDAIKEIMANIFRSAILLSPKECADLFYFFCVKLAPDYEGLETGIGHEILLKSVAKACGLSPKQTREQFQKEGDLGIVVQTGKSQQKSLGNFFQKKDPAAKQPITFKQVFETFKKIAKLSGNNSQNEKENAIVKLLQEATNEEAKYIVRWLQKSLKTGAAEKTFISALARAVAYTPPNKVPQVINARKVLGEQQFQDKCALIEYGINEAICESPNYGEIINTLLVIGDDMQKLKERCHIKVGIPVKPMLAKPTKGVREVLDRFEQLKFTCEYKYDGFRGQIHYDRSQPLDKQVEIYSRNLERMTNQYPDIVDFIKQSAKEGVDNFILDSELVAFDTINNRILPFQVLTQRSRKNVTEEDLKTKICICAFDLLFLNGQSLLKETFSTRRDQLHQNFNEISHSFVFAKYKDAEYFEAIEEFLNESVKDACEGLMIKTLEVNATYEPSKRSLNWLKLKKDYIDTGFGDSLDLVVVGADYGKGKRTGMFGSFLLACYDENMECLQTVTKMATGLSDEMLAKIYSQLKDLVIDKPPSNLKFKEKNIDVWIMPKYVWEIKCADLSLSPIYCAAIGNIESNKGIALRFPRFIRERDDKSYEDCTTSDQILDFFKSQPNMLGNEGDDDFDF